VHQAIRPLNAGELPQRGNFYLVELAALRRLARVQRAPELSRSQLANQSGGSVQMRPPQP
jgi:hypothetical protein